ncbi:MAG: hypothetical protein ABI629_13990 [bacterium]
MLRPGARTAFGLTARAGAALALLALIGLAAPAAAAPVLLRPQYRVEAALSPAKPQIDGTVEVAFTNLSNRTLEEAVFLLFANRFAEADADHLNDFIRTLVYPEQEYDRGGLQLLDVFDAGVPTHAASIPVPQLPSGTFVRVPIAPLPSGATRTLRLTFQTTVPYRFGSFGHFDDQLTMLGGWYPQLVPLDDSGQWAIDAPPPLADFDVTLTPAPGLDLILNGRFAPAGAPLVHAAVPGVHYLTLLAAPRFLRDETLAGGTRIVYLHRPKWLGVRISFGPSMTEIVLDTLRDIVVNHPAVVPAPPELVVVEAPLRLDLTAAGEGDVIVSDRLLEVKDVLRPFHELQLAQAVYAECLRAQLAPRETAQDYPWVSEGVSRLLADRYLDRVEPERRSVYDWIDMLNIFSAVDRFESTPKIPFTGAFFDAAKSADPLHAQIWSVNESGPPGHVVVTKMRALLDPPVFDPLLDRCLTTPAPLRECVADGAPSVEVSARLNEWLGPYPAIDYRVESTEFNVPEGTQQRSTIAVRRVVSRPFSEPVTVRLRTIGGETVDLHWKSGGDVALMSATTDGQVYQAVIDPDRQLIDDDRSNNAWLPRLQVVVDAADVEVSSTEFGFSGQLVGRLRYDYRKDVALTGFYTNRGVGFTAGPRFHLGEPIDGTRFRHNLYAFYFFEALDGSFKNDARPGVRTTGQLGGFGARYDYSNVFWGDAPSQQRRLRLFVDGYDKSLGGDYSYIDWGYVASGTLPLWTPRTVVAGQIYNGFSEPLGTDPPNQGLFSLGGDRTIRGIGAEEQLARNIFVLRTELRQEIYPELDLNLHDILILRRFNVHALLDTGQASNSAGRIYDPSHWAVGAGVGAGIFYEFFGFFPASAYLEVATRLDEKQGDVQVLFGSGQSF